MVVRSTINAAIPIPIEKIREICERYLIRELAIFGSALRDDFGTKSDTDLLVQFDEDAPVTLFTLGEITEELEDIFQRPVDLVPKEGLRWFLRDEILASAVVVYEAA